MLKQYVVAIGGSAGALDPLMEFFDHTPLNHASYVILRHLPANYKSKLNEILQRHSKLKVVEAKRDASIENDLVYYAPPYYQLIIEDGTLQFAERTTKSNHAIDIFMESLALNENKRKSVAIILSGSGGYDGIKGTTAIKKAGGLVIVQSPESCEFPQLPLEVIKSGNVDFVLLPKDMPGVIKKYVSEYVLD